MLYSCSLFSESKSIYSSLYTVLTQRHCINHACRNAGKFSDIMLFPSSQIIDARGGEINLLIPLLFGVL